MPIDMVQNDSCRAANNNEKNGEEVLFPPFDMDPEPSRRPAAIPILVSDSPLHSPRSHISITIARRYLEYVAKYDTTSFFPLGPSVVNAAFTHAGKTNWMRKTKILLIEYNRILRECIKAIINNQVDLKIVAASGGNHDTLLQARILKLQ